MLLVYLICVSHLLNPMNSDSLPKLNLQTYNTEHQTYNTEHQTWSH